MIGFVKVLFLSFAMLLPAVALSADVAPGFELEGEKGSIKLSDYRGKVVYLDFWASWCGPCRKSFPWMNEIQARFKREGLRVIAVNVDAEREDANGFITQMSPNFDIAFDPAGEVAERYDLQGMPSAYLIDRKGQLRSVHMGFRNKDITMLEREIEMLLNNDKTKKIR